MVHCVIEFLLHKPYIVNLFQDLLPGEGISLLKNNLLIFFLFAFVARKL